MQFRFDQNTGHCHCHRRRYRGRALDKSFRHKSLCARHNILSYLIIVCYQFFLSLLDIDGFQLEDNVDLYYVLYTHSQVHNLETTQQ